ncbi:MAG: interleukin-like EMT inducer domain-containing protein, partial [Actinomycetota bacterium]
RGVLAILAATLLGTGWILAYYPGFPSLVSPGPLRQPAPLLGPAAVLGFVLLALRGWAVSRSGAPRRLSEGDWVRLLLLLTGVFVILALGPVVHVRREPVGAGPYLSLYQLFPILHGLRVTTRFAVVAVAALGLLAALGLRALELGARPVLRWGLVGVLFLALGLEYAVTPARYQRVAWTPRPVDEVLRADPDDVAVLEWPTNVRNSDADAMVHALDHRRRLVNGLSGFTTPTVREFADLLKPHETVFPAPEAQAAFRRIYPLRYLVVRLGDRAISNEARLAWHALRRDPPAVLRFRGTFGKDDLYEVVPLPEAGTELERWVSYDFVRAHPAVRVGVRPLAADPDLTQWVGLSLNGRVIREIPLDGPITTQAILSPRFSRVAPNRIALRYGYWRRVPAEDARYRVGTTGAMSPGDVRVVSGGLPHGDVGSIQLNGAELSPNQRGYNLVALDKRGRVLAAAAFDTHARRPPSRWLAGWVQALPPGTIVAGAVRDDGSEKLTEEAVQALRTLGAAADLRGRFRKSHAFVGVKGAPPGSALEAIGPR